MRHPDKVEIDGSIPSARTLERHCGLMRGVHANYEVRFALVFLVQWIEHLTTNEEVVGSNPTEDT